MELSSLTPADGVAAMISFYCDERADGCLFDDDADMLLFQWGTYDWGQGESFEFNITRQLILGGVSEDENIWQLSLTFKFTPDDQLRQLKPGNRWCRSSGDIRPFQDFIHDSEPYRIVADRRPSLVQLDYECAG